jgi:predicted DNA-binding protein (MmcQ/YjbR family)
MTAEQAIVKLRAICLALPGAEEGSNHGHPTFRVRTKSFCTFHGWPGDEMIAVKVSKEIQAVFLKDPRFIPTPHAAHHGYVSLRIHGAPLDWEEVRELVAGSYEISLPRKKKIADKLK